MLNYTIPFCSFSGICLISPFRCSEKHVRSVVNLSPFNSCPTALSGAASAAPSISWKIWRPKPIDRETPMRNDPTQTKARASLIIALVTVLAVASCGPKAPVYTDANPQKLERACQAVDEATGFKMTETDRAWCTGLSQLREGPMGGHHAVPCHRARAITPSPWHEDHGVIGQQGSPRVEEDQAGLAEVELHDGPRGLDPVSLDTCDPAFGS